MTNDEFRKASISDVIWQQTHPTWLEMEPRKNYSQPSPEDETVQEYANRICVKYPFPLAVFEQWIFPLYYNVQTVKNYGWIDYTTVNFLLCKFSFDEICSFQIVQDFQEYVASKSKWDFFVAYKQPQNFIDFWREHGTWLVPPIVLHSQLLENIPPISDISLPYQLVEGHTRLGFLKAAHSFLSSQYGFKLKSEHLVYLMQVL